MVNETPQIKKSGARRALLVIAVLAIAGLAWFAYKNPTLFRATITGGETPPAVASTLYIPTDYYAANGDSGEIAVKAGQAFTNLKNLNITFTFDPAKITFYKPQGNLLAKQGDALYNIAATITQTSNTYQVQYVNIPLGKSPAQNAILFRLPVSLASNLTDGTPIEILSSSITVDQDADGNGTGEAISPATFSAGRITVSASATCPNTCGDHGACNFNTRQCSCNTGYGGLVCNECAAGYTGYPTCTKDIFGDLQGAILTLSPDTIANLSVEERKKAYSSVYVIIKTPPASFDMKVTIEGTEVTLSGFGTGTLGTLDDMAGNLIIDVDDPDLPPAITTVNATKVSGMVGVVKLSADINNVDGSLLGITANTDNVLIVPAVENTLLLSPTASYKVRVIGVFQNAKVLADATDDIQEVKDLNYTDLKWMPQPMNRLKSDALSGGLLERGDATGKGPVYVQIERASAATIRSNEIVVEVPSGPIIEYARIVGSAPIQRGGRVNLSVKVSDVDTISDIEDVRTSIVKTDQTTVAAINSDSSAVWFTATPFVDQVTVTGSGTEPLSGSASAEGASATPQTPAQPTSKNFKIYSIPVEIPQDTALVDGNYKLLLSLTDKAGHETNALLSIRVGAVATGDVNGDGNVNMLDVVIAFQIANKKIASPTQAQITAADWDGNGTVSIVDVVNLFNKVNKK